MSTLAFVDTAIAMGASLRTPMSWEDYLALGETKFTEYIDGLCIVNAPTVRHSRAKSRLFLQLGPVVPEGYELLDERSWRPEERREFIPDLVVSSLDTEDEATIRRPPPLLVVEIGSPSTRDLDWHTKMDGYAGGGAEWYWIVDLDPPRLTVFENRDGVFVEVQRIETAERVSGPIDVVIDPSSLVRRGA